MKEHMSITIADGTLARLKLYARQEHRSVSQVVEMAVEQLLSAKGNTSLGIVTTQGKFEGTFSRQETYGER